MCAISQATCYRCSRGEHDDCNGFAETHGPGACRGFPVYVTCACAYASRVYRTLTVASGLELPEHPNAGQPVWR